MPSYLIIETTEHHVSAHCEACAKDVFLSDDSSAEFTGVTDRSIELQKGEEPSAPHTYEGGF
ncbi:hypothetical protein D3C83_201430 [compost metagenome]